MDDKELFEKVYEKPDAVWTEQDPPEELVKLVESGKIKPCRVLDVGCGEGFYSIYLASKGFDVVGVDLSEKAIEYAKQNAKKAGVNIKFLAMGILDLKEEKFDFVFEWSIMHHMEPSRRSKYVENIARVLNKGGKYLSVSFNVKSPEFGKPGAGVREVPPGSRALVGAKLYFSSLEELRELFKSFRILESKIIHFNVKKPHIGNYFLLEA